MLSGSGRRPDKDQHVKDRARKKRPDKDEHMADWVMKSPGRLYEPGGPHDNYAEARKKRKAVRKKGSSTAGSQPLTQDERVAFDSGLQRGIEAARQTPLVPRMFKATPIIREAATVGTKKIGKKKPAYRRGPGYVVAPIMRKKKKKFMQKKKEK